MASQVYNEETIALQDETEVTLRPLPIGPLRRFMQAWAKFAEADSEDDGFDVFVNCAGIALESHFKGKFDSLKAAGKEREAGEFLSPEYKEYLEGVLDLDTIYKVLDVCGGLKLNTDPKALQEAANLAEVAGTA